MSPQSEFNIYMDDMVREINARMFDRDLSLVNTDNRVKGKSATICR